MMIQRSDISCVFITFCFALSSLAADNSTDSKNATFKCTKENDYTHSLDIREVLGKWRVVELYMHTRKEGVTEYKSCPYVTIWTVDEFPRSTFGPSTENQLHHVQSISAKFRQEYRHLRLLWDEAGQTAEYSLYFRNDSAGYWQVLDSQNGTMASQSNYQQFSGTIQVLKAVGNHLVLNFCQEPGPNRASLQYSVLFSREPGQMARWEIDAVHNLLQNKQLSVASRRMVCGNGAAAATYSIVFSVISCALACLLGKS